MGHIKQLLCDMSMKDVIKYLKSKGMTTGQDDQTLSNLTMIRRKNEYNRQRRQQVTSGK